MKLVVRRLSGTVPALRALSASVCGGADFGNCAASALFAKDTVSNYELANEIRNQYFHLVDRRIRIVSPTIPDVVTLEPLCRTYGVLSLAVFGSFARGEARLDSDLDLLVSFASRIGLLRMVAFDREVSELPGRKVDIQTESALSPYIKDRILKERQLIYAA